MTWTIDKQFSFCYGHRVWSQQLKTEFCDVNDASCKCRFLHGHQANVHVFLESDKLERGVVTDFKHLGWLNKFFDEYLDHKFIIDLNDPWLNNICNVEPMWTQITDITPSQVKPQVYGFKPRLPLNTSDERYLRADPVYAPNTDYLTGYKIDVTELSGVEREFFEGFFFTTFLPSSENFSKWVFEIAEAKMARINVQVSRVDWYETPKSRSSYSK